MLLRCRYYTIFCALLHVAAITFSSVAVGVLHAVPEGTTFAAPDVFTALVWTSLFANVAAVVGTIVATVWMSKVVKRSIVNTFLIFLFISSIACSAKVSSYAMSSEFASLATVNHEAEGYFLTTLFLQGLAFASVIANAIAGPYSEIDQLR